MSRCRVGHQTYIPSEVSVLGAMEHMTTSTWIHKTPENATLLIIISSIQSFQQTVSVSTTKF